MMHISNKYRLLVVLILLTTSIGFSFSLGEFIGEWSGMESFASDESEEDYENKNITVDIFEGGDREGYLVYTSSSSIIYNQDISWAYHYVTYDKVTGTLLFLRRFVTPIGLIGSQELRYSIIYYSNGMLELEYTDDNREVVHRMRLSLNALSIDKLVPSKIDLHQNYPNPFNPSTSISLKMDIEMSGALVVFDLNGSMVAPIHIGLFKKGKNEFNWYGQDSNGKKVPSGIYIYRLNLGQQVISRKMTLLY